MADFANEFIGGGAANFGCVQEEILFLIYPELFVSQIFMDKMDHNEAILIKGCRRFSKYTGYDYSLAFEDIQLQELADFDAMRRLDSSFVAIDAIPHDN